jgi:hypothetical protein
MTQLTARLKNTSYGVTFTAQTQVGSLVTLKVGENINPTIEKSGGQVNAPTVACLLAVACVTCLSIYLETSAFCHVETIRPSTQHSAVKRACSLKRTQDAGSGGGDE